MVVGIVLVFGFVLIGCDTGNGTTNNEASYDFYIEGITPSITVATIRGDVLSINFVEIADTNLKSPSESFQGNVTDVSPTDLKIYEIDLHGGVNLVLDLADSNKDRFATWYANKAGSFKVNDVTLTISGKGWNWMQANEDGSYGTIILDSNHNPDNDYKWTVLQNNNVIWSGTAQ
jgi:hypothetical protein